ncbi:MULTISPECIES: hypothetical protein [unclassified Flavobacterium]|uniref:hypothetical protein n=1 Tax=unclassified Flavobacterium TaxID=196869 RepID=UPI002602E790|nr:hypothetical protein [Flavobacterium sp.]
MKKNKTIIFLLLVLISFGSCENATEQKLLKIRNTTKFNESKQKVGFNNNIKREFTKEGIEYGVITLENSEKVKFWFQTHHMCEDEIGGTLFELPNGKLKFIEGYFCCEVQLPKNGKFKNSQELMAEMEKVDGIHP